MRLFFFLLLLVNFVNASSNSKNDSILNVLFKKLAALQSFECNIDYKDKYPGKDSACSSLIIKYYKNDLDSIIGYSFVYYDVHGPVEFYNGIIDLHLDYNSNTFFIDSVANKTKFGAGFYVNPITIKMFLKWIFLTKSEYHLIVNEGSYRLMFQTPFLVKDGYSIEVLTEGQPPSTSIIIDFDKKTLLPIEYSRVYIQSDSSRIAYIYANIKNYRNINCKTVTPSDSLPFGFEPARNATKRRMINSKAVNFKLTQLNGDTIELAKFNSNFVLIEFSTMNCGACRNSLPFIKSLRDSVPVNKLEILSIEDSKKVDLDIYLNYYRKEKFNYPLLINGYDVARLYRVQVWPTFFILDKDKMITDIFIGFRESMIKEILMRIN